MLVSCEEMNQSNVWTCLFFARGHLRWSFRDGLIAECLEGLHGSVVSGSLASAPLPDKLVTPHRELDVEDLGNGIMVPEKETNGRRRRHEHDTFN